MVNLLSSSFVKQAQKKMRRFWSAVQLGKPDGEEEEAAEEEERGHDDI